MTTKQQVIERLERLPESASLTDFKEELEIMMALKAGQKDSFWPALKAKLAHG